jgi:hypothetical protein
MAARGLGTYSPERTGQRGRPRLIFTWSPDLAALDRLIRQGRRILAKAQRGVDEARKRLRMAQALARRFDIGIRAALARFPAHWERNGERPQALNEAERWRESMRNSAGKAVRPMRAKRVTVAGPRRAYTPTPGTRSAPAATVSVAVGQSALIQDDRDRVQCGVGPGGAARVRQSANARRSRRYVVGEATYSLRDHAV